MFSVFWGNANRGIYFSLKKWPMIYTISVVLILVQRETCNIQNVSDYEKCASLILVSVSNQNIC